MQTWNHQIMKNAREDTKYLVLNVGDKEREKFRRSQVGWNRRWHLLRKLLQKMWTHLIIAFNQFITFQIIMFFFGMRPNPQQLDSLGEMVCGYCSPQICVSALWPGASSVGGEPLKRAVISLTSGSICGPRCQLKCN